MADHGRTTDGATWVDIESDLQTNLITLPGGEPIEESRARLQTTNGSTANVRCALLDPTTGAPLYYSNQLSFSDDTGGWKVITWPPTTPTAGTYRHAISCGAISGGLNTCNIAKDDVSDNADFLRASTATAATYPNFPASPAWDGPFGTYNASLFLRTTSGSAEPEITGISDATLTHGQTGIVVNVSGYDASGKTVRICSSDDVNHASAVTQTVTAQDVSTITFTAVLSSFAFGATLYVFVLEGGDPAEANADGEPISRIVASATLEFTGADFFFDENGDPVEVTGTLYVWRSPRPPASVGTPDQIIASFATSSGGERSQPITLGSLDDGDRVFGMLFGPDGTEVYWAGEKMPDYA